MLDEAEEEHQQAKALIAQIRDLGTADRAMDQLVADLARAIEDHVKEERDELFPKAQVGAGHGPGCARIAAEGTAASVDARSRPG